MLNKKAISLSAALMVAGLTGCGANEAMDTRYNDNFQPVGFYTNEENGTRTRNNDNMFDQVDARNTGEDYEATPQYDGGDIGDRGDLNYHGQLNSTLNSFPTRSYDDKFDNRLARRLENRIEQIDNIGNTHVIIDGDNILIAVDNHENGNEQNLEQEIRTITNRMAPGKAIQVVTDEGTVNRVQVMTDKMNNGGKFDDNQSAIRGILDDVGDALQRPFQNNR